MPPIWVPTARRAPRDGQVCGIDLSTESSRSRFRAQQVVIEVCHQRADFLHRSLELLDAHAKTLAPPDELPFLVHGNTRVTRPAPCASAHWVTQSKTDVSDSVRDRTERREVQAYTVEQIILASLE